MAKAVQSFESELNQLKSMYQTIESDIKKETMGRIEELIMENQFEQACAVIHHLRELVDIFDFEEKYTETQNAFMKYSESVFSKEVPPAIFQAEQLNHITKTLKQTVSQSEEAVVERPKELEPSHTNAEWYKKEIKEKFVHKHFRIVREEGDDIQLMKDNKNYHLNYSRPDWTKEEYIQLLNKKCTYKNIGFICRNEDEMRIVRGYVNEWLSTLSDAKKKFLVINYTWADLIKHDGEKTFIQTIV